MPYTALNRSCGQGHKGRAQRKSGHKAAGGRSCEPARQHGKWVKCASGVASPSCCRPEKWLTTASSTFSRWPAGWGLRDEAHCEQAMGPSCRLRLWRLPRCQRKQAQQASSQAALFHPRTKGGGAHKALAGGAKATAGRGHDVALLQDLRKHVPALLACLRGGEDRQQVVGEQSSGALVFAITSQLSWPAKLKRCGGPDGRHWGAVAAIHHHMDKQHRPLPMAMTERPAMGLAPHPGSRPRRRARSRRQTR